ncbi:MAG: tetratricopeptide (TPR) repeat protein [Bradymonadia bacterium]
MLGMAHTHLWERMKRPEHLPVALKALGAALQTQPADVRALKALARALVKQGQRQQAEAASNAAAQGGADDEAFMLDRASNLWAGRQITPAKTAYEAVLARYPSGTAWMGLAQVRARSGDAPGALAAFAEAAKFEGTKAAALTQMGSLALRKRALDVARTHLEAARVADPLYLPALLWQGTLAMDAGKPVEAVRLLDQVIARDPRAHPAYALRGQARIALTQYDAAFADFDHLITQAPQQLGPWVMYVQGALKAGRKDVARAKLAEALGRFPGNPQLMQAAQALR